MDPFTLLGVHGPLDVYLEGGFDEWQADQNRRNLSTCDFLVALIAMAEPDLLLSLSIACSGRSRATVKTEFTTGRLVARRATSSTAASWSPSRGPAGSPVPSQTTSHPS